MKGMSERKILHLDLDAFFCAVEELHNPALKGQPFAVGGSPDERGVVASCSYAARKFGVRSAMPMARAVRLCPSLIIVDRHHGEYSRVSKLVMAILHDLTPLVEQVSIDEAFLDVSDYDDSGESIARRLQARIREELNLPASLGVASNKLVAKIANNVGKDSARKGDYPNAITVVPAGQEAAFLAPLPTRELWGVGPVTAEKLARLGISTIGELAAYPVHDLVYHFGKYGREMWEHAQGIDTRPIITQHEIKSVSRETTFARDVSDAETLKHTLHALSQSVGRQLRRKHLSGNTIKIKLRWSDFTTFTRQVTLPYPIESDEDIYRNALYLLEANRSPNKRVRLIGVGVSGFKETPVRQLGLWEAPAEADRRLQDALDHLWDRFGEGAVQRVSDLMEEEDW